MPPESKCIFRALPCKNIPNRHTASLGSERGAFMRAKARRGSHHSAQPLDQRLTMACLWLLIFVTPFVFSLAAVENFRLPKKLLSECLALASLVCLSWRLRSRERVDWRSLGSHPAVLAAGPFVVVATFSLWTTDHPGHVRTGLVALWIGFASLVGWSLGLAARDKRRLLTGMMVPAAGLSLLVVLQNFNFYTPLHFAHSLPHRLDLTSLAGSPFDLSAYLLLPILVAQLGFTDPSPRRRWWSLLVGALCLYGLVITLTMTSILALGAASLVLWLTLFGVRRLLPMLILGVVVAAVLVLGIGSLRQRLEFKMDALVAGDTNKLLTGRLDGWRAALWMFEKRPLLGVGHGAYGAEFANAKLALTDEGVSFFPLRQGRAHFTSAHNEFLEIAAECGWPGIVALGWGLWILFRQLWRRQSAPDSQNAERRDRALIWAGVVALLVQALATFPFHLALVAYPALLLLSWPLARVS
jgi:O-antigen ligase